MEEKSPTVSVVIPCFNGERFLGEAVESVLAQTFSDYEIIVVDDGSTDGSCDVIKSYLSCGKLRHIGHERNLGIPAARNSGIRASRGRFVAFLDQDDLWKPEKLEKQVAFLNDAGRGDIGLVFSGMEEVWEKKPGGPRKKRHVPRGFNGMNREQMYKALFLKNFIPIVSALIRRECFDDVGLLNENIRGGADDYEFCLRLLDRYRFHYLPSILVVRRLHGANYSDCSRSVPETIEFIEDIAASNPHLKELKARRISSLLCDLGVYHLSRGEREQAAESLRRAIGYYPFDLRLLSAYLVSRSGRLGLGLSRVWYSFRNPQGKRRD